MNNRGISLIEVLVALVIVSIGLLALASFQSDLMSTSGENKTRSEAQNLAEDKVEELKNNILLTGFEAALVSGSDAITGTNAEFTRTWTVSTGSLSANHKVISVSVAWTGDSITIDNENVWFDPAMGVVATNAADGEGNPAVSPSPNNNSSTVGGEDRISATDGTQLGDGTTSTDPLNKLWKKYDSSGNIVIYNNTNTSASLTCYGDKTITFSGTVYSVNSLTDLSVDISELGVCYFDETADTVVSGYHSAPYACVACGNCDEGGDGCPATPVISNGIGAGGWRGKIGLRGIDDSGGSQEQVCFNEQILDPDAGASTGREYTTHRTNTTTSEVTSEGINTPYECHDFLVVNRSGPSSSCSSAASDLSSETNIAPKKFTRNLYDSDLNTVLAADSSYCSLAPASVTLTGEITLVETGGSSVNLNKLTLSTDAAGTCDTLSTNTPGTYSVSCNATTVASSITITLDTTQSGAVISPVSSYTVSNADNAAAFTFTVTK